MGKSYFIWVLMLSWTPTLHAANPCPGLLNSILTPSTEIDNLLNVFKSKRAFFFHDVRLLLVKISRLEGGNEIEIMRRARDVYDRYLLALGKHEYLKVNDPLWFGSFGEWVNTHRFKMQVLLMSLLNSVIWDAVGPTLPLLPAYTFALKKYFAADLKSAQRQELFYRLFHWPSRLSYGLFIYSLYGVWEERDWGVFAYRGATLTDLDREAAREYKGTIENIEDLVRGRVEGEIAAGFDMTPEREAEIRKEIIEEQQNHK